MKGMQITSGLRLLLLNNLRQWLEEKNVQLEQDTYIDGKRAHCVNRVLG